MCKVYTDVGGIRYRYHQISICTRDNPLAKAHGLISPCTERQMSRDMRFPTMWYVRPAKSQIMLAYSLSVKLLTEHHLEFNS